MQKKKDSNLRDVKVKNKKIISYFSYEISC